jgi:hypothetical protein
MSAIGPKQTSLAAPHMSAFGGKADMTLCGNPLSRSLLGVKQTWLFAVRMSAFDPKRTWALALTTNHESLLRQFFKPRFIQKSNLPVLMIDQTFTLPILKNLIDALTCNPNELSQSLLRKMQFNLEALRA